MSEPAIPKIDSLSGPKDRLKITKQNEIVLCTLTVLREKLAGLPEISDHRHTGGAPAWVVVYVTLNVRTGIFDLSGQETNRAPYSTALSYAGNRTILAQKPRAKQMDRTVVCVPLNAMS